MRCQRSRAKRLHRGSTASTANAIESSELKRSRSGGDLSNTDTVATQVNFNLICFILLAKLSWFFGNFLFWSLINGWKRSLEVSLLYVLWSSSSVRIIIRCHCVVMNKRDLYQGKKALITEKKVMLMSPFFLANSLGGIICQIRKWKLLLHAWHTRYVDDVWLKKRLGSTKYYLLGVGKSSICLGLGKDQQGGADVQGSKKWQDTEDIYSAKFVLTLRDSVRDTTLNMRPTIYYYKIQYSSRSFFLLATTTDVEELEQFVFEHIIGKQCCY